MTRILVMNAGSSSLKWSVFDATSEALVQHASVSWPEQTRDRRHATEIDAALVDVERVDAIGHRVVHGGAMFRTPVRVDASVRRGILDLAELAPLHNPAAVAVIDAAARIFPGVPQVAVFDTAFHASIPDAAAIYPVPWEWTERWRLRRFGFHGLSVDYAVKRASEILGRLPSRLIVCHLGAGCSVTAVLDGRSIDTSMGFTPLEGVMMGHRSGSIDPGLMLFLQRVHGLTALDLETALNERSGLIGVAGDSGDMRDVVAGRAAHHPRAALAFDMFVQRLVAAIGAQLPGLGGLDALVFTGGIGENSHDVRLMTVERLAFLGVSIDNHDSGSPARDRDISAPSSPVRVLVIAAREDLTVLRAVKQTLLPP